MTAIATITTPKQTDEETVVIEIIAQGNKVWKHHIRSILGMNRYSFTQCVEEVAVNDEGFKKAYFNDCVPAHRIPLILAKKIIQFNYEEVIKFKVARKVA